MTPKKTALTTGIASAGLLAVLAQDPIAEAGKPPMPGQGNPAPTVPSPSPSAAPVPAPSPPASPDLSDLGPSAPSDAPDAARNRGTERSLAPGGERRRRSARRDSSDGRKREKADDEACETTPAGDRERERKAARRRLETETSEEEAAADTPGARRRTAAERKRRAERERARDAAAEARAAERACADRDDDADDEGAQDGGSPRDGTTLAPLRSSTVRVPNFVLERFSIPPFLLPIYQAAGTQYGVRWEVLAAINEAETNYGRNLAVSSAGAEGWMQFMPATWTIYGTDANGDGRRDPYNPVDAIFSAARYLRAAGAERDLRKAVLAYNHSDAYADGVIQRATVLGSLPANLVASLTGLTQGTFPVRARASYPNGLRAAERVRGRAASYLVGGTSTRRSIDIAARAGAPVVAVADGRIVRTGRTSVRLQDAYGNTYSYGNLRKVAPTYAAPAPRSQSRASIARELRLPARDPVPSRAASAGTNRARQARDPVPTRAASAGTNRGRRTAASTRRPASGRPAAAPARRAAAKASQAGPATRAAADAVRAIRSAVRTSTASRRRSATVYDPSSGATTPNAPARDLRRAPLRAGARVPAGTVLGRIGATPSSATPKLRFEVRPAGHGAPPIDPQPLLDGWKLLESTKVYGGSALRSSSGDDATPAIGRLLMMGKDELAKRVLSDPRIDIYSCGRRDIRLGLIDRRVLATLELLASSGLKPTVTSLRCGHSRRTSSGTISYHSMGSGVDVAAINGIPIAGHQGSGSVTEAAIQRLLTLQGAMQPDEIISLMRFEGAGNTLSMRDHGDHIHIGWTPLYGSNTQAAKQVAAIIEPDQWQRLMSRLGEISNPRVPLKPSRHALKATTRAGAQKRGD